MCCSKIFQHKLNEYCKSADADHTDLHFLYCNAHFLLGLSSGCEKVLKVFEQHLIADIGHKLGRDEASKYFSFRNAYESAAARYIRTCCDSFGPRGNEKNGCKKQWEAFCKEKLEKKSTLTSFRMNRFNNFFKGAASAFYHRLDIVPFLSGYRENVNMKLESVQLDASSHELQALVRALGIIFYKITGPFWALLHSEIEYVDQDIYIKMLGKFRVWSEDSTPLLSNDCESIFSITHTQAKHIQDQNSRKKESMKKKFELENLNSDPVYLALYEDNIPYTETTVNALQDIFNHLFIAQKNSYSIFYLEECMVKNQLLNCGSRWVTVRSRILFLRMNLVI